MSLARNERAPTRTTRLIHGNAGSPTGRESYGDGPPIVVGGWESQPQGEGAALERGPEFSLDKGEQGRCHRLPIEKGMRNARRQYSFRDHS